MIWWPCNPEIGEAAKADVLTGLVSNGRPETRDSERALGLFLNTLPFRQRLSGGTWLDLVKATFAAERALLPYRRYPLARLQQTFGEQPLFETAFNFVHFHVYAGLQDAPGLEVLSGGGFQQTNLWTRICTSLGHHWRLRTK